MKFENYSDYGSGNSMDSTSSLTPPGFQYQSNMSLDRNATKPSSYNDLMTGKCSLDDVMKEFRMNGLDTPYNPEEDNIWSPRAVTDTSAPWTTYGRQVSWPAPEHTPKVPLPKSHWTAALKTSTPVHDDTLSVPSFSQPEITMEQLRVLNSLPDVVLYSLLRKLERTRGEDVVKKNEECRFCKNNGERESYYRSHSLKSASGAVACPVLRAFVCGRCGASGDTAHTAKYCPYTTNEERLKSTAMMRSVRMASNRRRFNLLPSIGHEYVTFGEPTPSVVSDSKVYNAFDSAPLDPLWAALEQKLML